MPCTITDNVQYYNNALTPVPLENQIVLAVPGADYMRISISSSYRLLGVNPGITTAAYKFGIQATTDGAGSFSLTLPYGEGETHPTSPAQEWSIVMPDGRIFSGTVPAVAGPLSIDDLITTYGWIVNTAVYVAPVTAGALARGTAVITADDSASIVFLTPFASNTYVITLSASIDSVTGAVVEPNWSNKTTTGFDITLSGVATCSVDWTATLS